MAECWSKRQVLARPDSSAGEWGAVDRALSGDAHAVAARRLGLIERFVGAGEKFVAGHLFIKAGDQAETGRDGAQIRQVLEAKVTDGKA